METSIDTWFGGGEFNPDVLEEDFNTIRRLYAEYGYLETEVSLLRKAPGNDREHIDLYIKIDEGPRSYVGDITWEGNEVVADSVIEKAIALEKGEPLSIAGLEMTQGGIQNLYMEKGYIWSRIIPRQKVNRSDIDIDLDITENNQARIKEIKISGNTKTFENVIRRELDVYPGELFILKDVRRSVREIFQLGYFQGPPMINPERVNEEGDINLLIEVEEKQTGNFKSGFGFSQLNKLTGFIGLSETNFLGRGKSISINWEFGKYRENMNIQYSEAHLFNTETYFSASVYNWIQNRVQQLYYSDRRKGFSLQFGLHLP
jgi:outer membrane protein insertion porin family